MAGWNLALRFGLEVAALVALGLAGWKLGVGATHWILAVGFPVTAAVAWTTFNVAGDPSRSGRSPVEVSGWVRLGLELVVLIGGASAIWLVGRPGIAVGLSLLVVVHYGASLDRVGWLVDR